MFFCAKWKVLDMEPDQHSFDFNCKRMFFAGDEYEKDEIVNNVIAHFDPGIEDLIGAFLSYYADLKETAVKHGADVLSEMKARDLASMSEARNRAEQGIGPKWNKAEAVCTDNIMAMFFHISARKSFFDFMAHEDKNSFFRSIFKTEDPEELMLWCMRFEATEEMTPRFPYLMYRCIVQERFKSFSAGYPDEVMSRFLYNVIPGDDGFTDFEVLIAWPGRYNDSFKVRIENVKKEHPIVQEIVDHYDWHIADLIGSFLDSFPFLQHGAEKLGCDVMTYMKQKESDHVKKHLHNKKDPLCFADKDASFTVEDVEALYPFIWDDVYFSEAIEADLVLSQMRYTDDPEEFLFWSFRFEAYGGFGCSLPYSLYKAIMEGRFKPYYDRYDDGTLNYFIFEEQDPFIGIGFIDTDDDDDDDDDGDDE